MAINENLLFPCNMSVVVLVTDCHRQCAGHRLGWMSAVTHNNRDEKLFLPLPVEGPQSRQRRCAVEVVLEVEITVVSIFRGDTEVEGWAVLRRVPVYGSQERGGLVQFYHLNKNSDCNFNMNAPYQHEFSLNLMSNPVHPTCGPATFSKTTGAYGVSNSGPLSLTSSRGSWTVALPVSLGTP